MNLERDLWVPDFETELIEIAGQAWPIIAVYKWERNGLGERRLVDSRIYAEGRPPTFDDMPKFIDKMLRAEVPV